MIVKYENRTSRGLENIFLVGILIFLSLALNAQSDKKYIRKGNREFDKSKFSDSEVSYRKAIDKNSKSPDAVFNIGDALYKQNKFEEAGKQFLENINQNDDKTRKSAGFYNLGNSLLKANKLPESIEAYKESLKLRPDNNEAKYNLAYAQDMLVKQKEQEKQQQNQDKDKDKNKEDQKKDQKDQKDKDQKKDQDSSKDQKDQKQQKQEQEISKEDAQRLLNALANDEKNVQEKVKLAKASKAKVRTVKNW